MSVSTESTAICSSIGDCEPEAPVISDGKSVDDASNKGVEPLTPDWSGLERGRLYNRHMEIKELEEAFERQLLGSNSMPTSPDLTLISGPRGSGCTVLAKKVFYRPGVTNFCMGKFDQLTRAEPFYAFAQAISGFVHDIRSRGQPFVVKFMNDILERRGLPDDTTDLNKGVDRMSGIKATKEAFEAVSLVVPELKKLLGAMSNGEKAGNSYEQHDAFSEQSTASFDTFSYQEASQDRLKKSFLRVFRSICSLEQPLVLLLDDLQYAESSSLEVLESLLCDNSIQGLVVVGTRRTDCCGTNATIPEDRLLDGMLGRLEDVHVSKVTKVTLRNFDAETIQSLVSDVLQQPPDVCEPLVEMIMEQTRGKPIYVVQLLKMLIKSKTLVPDHDGRVWLWDPEAADKVMGQEHAGNFEKFIQREMATLPTDSLKLLKCCACVGDRIDTLILSRVLVDMFVPDAVGPLLKKGYLVDLSNTKGPLFAPGCYAFAHDAIQSAAYGLMQEENRNRSHLKIGRMLLQSFSHDESHDRMFLIVNQMSRGMAYLSNAKEKTNLAELCFKVGRQATLFGDRNSAVMHYMLATTLLNPATSWKLNYNLCLEIYSSLAEAEHVIGDIEMTNFAVQEVLLNAQSPRDKIRANMTRIYSLGARSLLKEAIEVGLQLLKALGETFPARLNKPNAVSELGKIKKRLKDKTDVDILGLPENDHRDTNAIMEALGILGTYSLIDKSDIFPFVALKMVKLSLEHGICPSSPLGFAMYGFYLCSAGEAECGYKYGKLAMGLLNRYQHVPACYRLIRARVHTIFFGWIAHWSEPLHLSTGPTMKAHRDSLDKNDIEYAMVSAQVYCLNAFYSGMPLPKLEFKVEMLLDLMKKQKHRGPWVEVVSILRRTVKDLIGSSMTKEDEALSGESGISNTLCVLEYDLYFFRTVMKLVVSYHHGDYDTAMEMAKASRDSHSSTLSSYLICIQAFYDGMSALAKARISQTRHRHSLLMTARKSLLRLKNMAEKSPKNLQHKVHLMEAEFAALNGSLDRAMKAYDMAILGANEMGFLQDEALACERAALTQKMTKDPAAKSLRFTELAKGLYLDWGGIALADKL